MKKAIFTFALLVFCVSAAMGEPPAKRNEITVGVGVWGSTNTYEGLAAVVGGLFSFGGYGIVDYRLTPLVQLNYKNRISKRSSFGATLVWGGSRFNERIYRTNTGEYTVAPYNNNFFSVSGEYEIRYVALESFALYGDFGFGVALYNQVRNSGGPNDTVGYRNRLIVYPDFQITPLGMKFGNSFGGFLEFGYGYKGIISGGLFARF